ncbi:DUF305 domain-containing protein [Planobispora takensis]|uniref:DUF305 domain-containing protein n=1 Tax=Planobispora takensis TaxID=1367882 RepID=A0A8J3WWZ4_9ACTN|nr:DUF305 domain-containing protein [Planobispora takensis]GII05336.1 DUF305 domain-containing protein [Planobispora takensis]
MNRTPMRCLALVLAVAGVLGTSACGAGAVSHRHAGPAAGGTAPAAGPFNAADVMFLQMMIPHDRQGAELATLAETRSARERVRTLAAAIAATQGDEVRIMAGWLRAWRQPPEAEPHAHDAHGGLHATSPEEAVALAELHGAAFDTRFLNVLIAHQHNAVDMARTEVRTGRNPQVMELARRIDRSRSEQIRQMLTELSSWGVPGPAKGPGSGGRP